jgi:hypothetical protein
VHIDRITKNLYRYSRRSLSSWLFSDLYLINLLFHLKKNLRSLNPIYNHTEARITQTTIKNNKKIPIPYPTCSDESVILRVLVMYTILPLY